MAFQRRCRPDILRLLNFVLFISIDQNPCVLADADSIHISGVGGNLFPHPGRKAARAKHIPKCIPQDFRQEEGRPSWGDTIETRRPGLPDRSRRPYRCRRPYRSRRPHRHRRPYRSRRSYRSHRPYRCRRNRRRARNLLQDETGIPWYNYGGNQYRARKHAPARLVREE